MSGCWPSCRSGLAGGGGPKARDYLRWVQASVGSTLRVIPTSDILLPRRDKYTRVQTRASRP